VTASPPLVKPLLRGRFHEAGFYLALVLGTPLILTAEPGRARFAASVFVACLAGCFGASALYHRPTWSPGKRVWLARLDHAGIYLLIAGTYTPIGLIVLEGAWRPWVLAIVWSGATAAIFLKLFWVRVPKWVSAVIALTLGWVGIVAIPELLKLPVMGVSLLLLGGAFYSVGAVIYALKRPSPVPHVFGYHELFHVLTLAAAACQFASIAFYVLPRA
jgi:hemolysin III